MMTVFDILKLLVGFFKSKGHVIALFIFSSARAATSPEFRWPDEALNWHLSYLQSNRYPALYVEVDAVEGREPTEDMLNALDAFLRKHCDKPSGITIKRSSVIPRKTARGYSADSLAAGYLDGPPAQTNSAPPAFLYILFYDSRVNANVLQSPRDASQRRLRDPLPADMSRRQDPHVNFFQYPAMIYFDAGFGPGVLSPKELPELALLHEAGHTLGLVSRDGRINIAHCTNSLCLMQPTFRMRYFFVPWLRDKIPKPEICSQCAEELKHRRSLTTTNQMRFVGPVLVRSTPVYSVFYLPGGLGLYSGNSVDQEAGAFLSYFKERFAATKGKLERWFLYKIEPNENLPTVIQAALADPVPGVRELARHMQKTHNIKLPGQPTAAQARENKAN